MDHPEDMRIGEQVDSKSIARQRVAGSSPVSSALLKTPRKTPCFSGCFSLAHPCVPRVCQILCSTPAGSLVRCLT